ncbi:MAG: diguanylate cyclase, partial [Candidatus Poribacteria bacterium]|nr:diguanylate cyclase [Candidatus Poribacteria bacterium]
CFDALAADPYDLLLADCEASDFSAPDLMEELQQKEISVPLVVFAAAGNEAKAVEAMQHGAYDYLIRDANQNYLVLLPAVAEAVHQRYQTTQQNLRYREELIALTKQLAEVAIQDRLTGLYNRRKMEIDLEVAFESITRYDYPVSCLMLEIDHFKRIHDTYGPRIGDFLIRALSLLLTKMQRKTDSCYRYSNEEFFILMPHTSIAGAEIFASRLQPHIRDSVFEIDGQSLQITVSIGIAEYQRGEVKTAEKLLRCATSALAEAKSAGPNRISAWRIEVLPLEMQHV